MKISSTLRFRKAALLAYSLVAPWIVRAQNAPPPAADTGTGNDQVVQMSLFSVTTTQDKGYVVDNSASGFKTSQSLIDIPQSIVVVTRDMIDDTDTFNPTDTLRYAGVATQFSGAAFNLRGTRVTPLVDGMSGDPSADPVNIDSYQLITGPVSVFYAQASRLGGVVLETTRKPLDQTTGSLSAGVNSFGFYRTELDATGRMFAIGEAKFDYRIDAAYQDGGMFFAYMSDKREIFDPEVELRYKNTTAFFQYNYELWNHIGGPGNEAAFVNYDGSLFVPSGGGLKWADFLMPNSGERFELNTVRAGLSQRFSDTWELNIEMQQHRYVRGPSVVAFTDDVNFNDRTFNVFYRDNDLRMIYDYVQADVTGRYDIWILPAQSTFGMSYYATKSVDRLDDRLLPPGWPATDRGPIDNPGPYLSSYVLPSVAQYNALPGTADQYFGTWAYTTYGYFQEQIDAIPKYLSLVAGMGYLTSTAYNVADLHLEPQAATISKTDPPPLHRYGAVLHVTKEIALYGLYSQTAQGAQQVQEQEIFPGTQGIGKEIGIKTDLNDGAISITASAYNYQTTNQLVYTGVINPANGEYVYANIGTTGTKGYSIDAAVRITPQWQLMGHFDHSPVVTVPGDGVVAGTDKGILSFFTRFDITRQLTVGGGYSRTLDATVSTSGITFLPGQNASVIDVKSGNEVSLFATYRFARHWTVRLGVENLLNSIYPQGINAIVQIDPSPPLQGNVRLTYAW